MANIQLKTLKFPGLADTYTVPQKTSDLTNDSSFLSSSDIDATLSVQGKVADAKQVGDMFSNMKATDPNNDGNIVITF